MQLINIIIFKHDRVFKWLKLVQPLKIISIVSNSSGVDTPLWGRGEELIPGALLAAQEVNSNEDVLNGFHIEVVPLDSVSRVGVHEIATDKLLLTLEL